MIVIGTTEEWTTLIEETMEFKLETCILEQIDINLSTSAKQGIEVPEDLYDVLYSLADDCNIYLG